MISYNTIDQLFDYTTAIIIIIVLFSCVYYNFSTSSYDTWRKLNVPHNRPVPFFGNTYKMSMKLENQVDTFSRIYEQFANDKCCGLYQMQTSYLMVHDSGLVNRIMIKDFSYFTDHGIDVTDPAVNVMANSLFFLIGQRWKSMRQIMNSGFTSSKLRATHDQMNEFTDQQLLDRIDETLKQSDQIEVKKIVGRFVTDVIGTCAFGLKLYTIKNENSEFRIHARKIFQPSIQQLFVQILQTVCPRLVKAFKMQIYPPDSNFFYSVFDDVIKHRIENNVVRNDLIQTLIEARKKLVLNDLDNESKIICQTVQNII